MKNEEALIQERESERQKKIRTLLTLWRDPALTEVVEVLRNANGRPLPQPQVPTRSIKAMKIGEAVFEIATRLPTRLSSRHVMAELERGGFEFKAKDRRGSVRDVLYALAKAGTIKLVKKAEGDEPNLYEWPNRPPFEP
jgi:hypothetical protein